MINMGGYISHDDLALRFSHVKDRALHLGWANYVLERSPVPYKGGIINRYRIVNSLAKGTRRIPFGETYCTSKQMLHFLNGYDHAMHDISRNMDEKDD